MSNKKFEFTSNKKSNSQLNSNNTNKKDNDSTIEEKEHKNESDQTLFGKVKSLNSDQNYKKFKNQRSNSSRIPYFALLFFIGVFVFTLVLIMLPFLGITSISIFGVVILPKNVYLNLLDAIVTTTDITNFYNTSPIAFFGLIVIIFLIIGVLIKFISGFREPETEFDQQQTIGSITYFNFTKLYSRVRLIFIKPTNDKNSDVIKEFVGTVYNFSSDTKTRNAVYCVPDKRNNKDQSNFFLEFPECFDIAHFRNYTSEHSWITLATNLAMTITVTILVVGTLLNVALNIITQAQLNPYLIFGFTSWISLSAIISISVVLIWALREIKGTYGVFRIIKVSKSPLDIDRYIVIPYYYDGISGSEIDEVLATYLKFNNEKINKLPESTTNSRYLPVSLNSSSDFSKNLSHSDLKIEKSSPDNSQDIENLSVQNEENADIISADIPEEKDINILDLKTFNFNLSDLHSSEYYVTEIDQLKHQKKTLEMEKERALLIVEQLSQENTNLKKAIRARKSIDYSTVRSLNSLQDRESVQQGTTQQVEHLHVESNGTNPNKSNPWILPLIILGIIGAIGVYWASITFSSTQFLVIIVLFVVFIIVIILFGLLLLFRQYLNETSSGKKINFG